MVWVVFGVGLAITLFGILWHLSNFEASKKPESRAYYEQLPGVDLASASAALRPAIIEELNRQNCTCGCQMTLAECRNRDPSCKRSVSLCKDVVARFSESEKGNKR